MRSLTAVLVAGLLLLPGCSHVYKALELMGPPFEWGAIGLGLLRSPVTLSTPEVNVCLDPKQRRMLAGGLTRPLPANLRNDFGGDGEPRRASACYQN